MITIKEMSKMLGLSTATISNVINGKEDQVSEATIKKVRNVLEQYEYIPNMTARNLASSKSKLIGVAMVSCLKDDNCLKDAFMSELLGSIELNLRKQGYFMLTYFNQNPLDLAKAIVSWNVEGLILFGIGSEDCINITKKFNKPKVFIDTYLDNGLVDGVIVGLEDEKGGYMVGQYLIECGHKKIAYFADNIIGINLLRFKGLKKAFNEAGLPSENVKYYKLDSSDENIQAGLERVYSLRNEYTAFFCASDYQALHVCNYFVDKGLKIPDDISIVGYDDSIYSRLSRPAITTVRQSPSKKGEIAVEYIFKQIENNSLMSDEITLPVELIKRGSVRNFNSII